MSGVLLVTGGSRGIGASVARLAAARGYAVCVNYRSDARAADAVVAEIRNAGGAAAAVQADVVDEQQIQRLFDATAARLGPVTALVCNAGITGLAGRLDETTPETIRNVIDLNVTGLMLCSQEAVRRMSTQHGGAGGAIVNISSGAATLGSPGEYTWYAGSKAAVDTFTKGLAIEVAEEGIRVNAVAPGLIETEIHTSSGQPGRVARLSSVIPMRRAGKAEEVAEPVLWLLSDAASYVTGAVLRVAGGR